jgi:hypothetical protein
MKPLNLFLLVVPILFCLTSPAQKNEISLLNGRFFCTFPDSAKNIARATDIMAADPNTNRETRVIFDIGDKRVVFFAEELYIKSVADLEKRLKEESTKDYPLAIKTIYDKDSAICISMTPSQFDNTQAAIYVKGVVVKNPDNTLSRLSVYFNPKAFADKPKFDKIVELVIASFRKGNRRLNLDARTETFAVLGTKTQMLVKLPKDYVVILDKKYDFEVYRVRKVTSYGEVDHADLNIYYGFHPSFFNTELDLSKFKEADTPGEFMFQKIHWMNFRDDSRQLILREQLFTDDDIQKDAQIHIGMISNNSKLIEEMTDIIKQLLLKYDK